MKFETTKDGQLICPNSDCCSVNTLHLTYTVQKTVRLLSRHASGEGFHVGDEESGDWDHMQFFCGECGVVYPVEATDETLDLH